MMERGRRRRRERGKQRPRLQIYRSEQLIAQQLNYKFFLLLLMSLSSMAVATSRSVLTSLFYAGSKDLFCLDGHCCKAERGRMLERVLVSGELFAGLQANKRATHSFPDGNNSTAILSQNNSVEAAENSFPSYLSLLVWLCVCDPWIELFPSLFLCYLLPLSCPPKVNVISVFSWTFFSLPVLLRLCCLEWRRGGTASQEDTPITTRGQPLCYRSLLWWEWKWKWYNHCPAAMCI